MESAPSVPSASSTQPVGEIPPRGADVGDHPDRDSRAQVYKAQEGRPSVLSGASKNSQGTIGQKAIRFSVVDSGDNVRDLPSTPLALPKASPCALGKATVEEQQLQEPEARIRSFLDRTEGAGVDGLLEDAAVRRGISIHSLAQNDKLLSNSSRSLVGWKSWMHFNRIRVWIFLEEPFLDWKASIVSFTMVAIIFASLHHSIRLHDEDSQATWDATWNDRARRPDVANGIFNIVFCLDLAMRVFCSPSCRHFLRNPKNVIDVLSVLPFFCNDVLDMPAWAFWVRPMRHLSSYEAFLRLLKLARYFWGWHLMMIAIKESLKALVIPMFFLILMVMFGSCTLYVVETLEFGAQGLGEEEIRDLTLESRVEMGLVTIRSLPNAMHFSIICILSMETGPFYGLQAASTVGQLVAVCLMFFGMTFMAMPIAIVGSVFADTWFHQDRLLLLETVRSRLQAQGFEPQELLQVFEEIDKDGSGELDFDEFMAIVKALNLRSLTPAKCRSLFQYFDHDSDGAINFTDFALTLFPDMPGLNFDATPGVGPHCVLAADSRPASAGAGAFMERSSKETTFTLRSRTSECGAAKIRPAEDCLGASSCNRERCGGQMAANKLRGLDERGVSKESVDQIGTDDESFSDSEAESEKLCSSSRANTNRSLITVKAARSKASLPAVQDRARRLEEMALKLEETFEQRMSALAASVARQAGRAHGPTPGRNMFGIGQDQPRPIQVPFGNSPSSRARAQYAGGPRSRSSARLAFGQALSATSSARPVGAR